LRYKHLQALLLVPPCGPLVISLSGHLRQVVAFSEYSLRAHASQGGSLVSDTSPGGHTPEMANITYQTFRHNRRNDT